MKKEHLIGLALGMVVLLVAAGMYLMPAKKAPVESVIEEVITPVETFNEQPAEELFIVEEVEEDEVAGGNVTRIIIEDLNGGSEISDILSEKVIVDDRIIDKSDIKKE